MKMKTEGKIYALKTIRIAIKINKKLVDQLSVSLNVLRTTQP